EIRPQELFTLLGPSGSGKSTVLRSIAGLISIDRGRILIKGEDVRDIPTYKRNIGMVFQSLALFPHMSVFDNIAFPLRMRRTGRGEISRRVADALDIVRLPNIARRKVHELSGGQQQRVALARALVYNPSLLLLDEPFGALDKRLREEMQLEIVRLHREIDVTIINVTHDQVEAMILSDRIGVMNEGRIVQVETGEGLYRRPKTRFVADFLGRANSIDGIFRRQAGAVRVVTPGGAELEVEDLFDLPDGAPGTAIIRAEDIELHARRPDDPAMTGLAGKVELRLFEGETVYYEVVAQGIGPLIRIAGKSGTFQPGSEVWLAWPRDRVWLVGE
ncbi:MAG TPA: ABC transporter ATP-binding protein, partial [Rhodobacteraceae bacterium]|nr:ABC transporter ATP-binding protein [Paracoccaceae bacterium]